MPARSDDTNKGHPKQIGPYRILDVLGEGGMAVVYLAEQTNHIKRQVALKVVKLGMDSKYILARFESERQALAVLDHPNIAKIFDGGITESGRSYFAMERVRGMPITDYCDSHRLDAMSRVRLFIDVCSAVQHAHHKGMIHRDLKPSNILVGVVDGKPQAKIIDFGIAKATGVSFTERTLFTRIGQVVGTPQYMSPEQADITGLDVDTRTDVYSLGVVLYELLVGTLPLDLTGITDHAINVALMEREPPRPSTRIAGLGDAQVEIAAARSTTWHDLRRQLRGDLDWIVMKAISKDRTRRYETANALAMECRRVLNHEPVLARPPSAGYLVRRFVRRNRTGVVAGLAVLLAVIAGATAATVGFVRATRAEQTALRQAETSRQVSEFLVELFRVSDPSEARGNTITAREILDKGAVRIRSELTSAPEVQAVLMNTMGNVYSSLGLYEAAQLLLDEALRDSEKIFGRKSVETADTLFNLGVLARLRGDYSKAEAMHRDALSIRESVLGLHHVEVAESLHGLGITLYFQSRYEEAGPVLQRALTIYTEQYGEAHEKVAAVMSSLASLLHSTSRFEEAETYERESLDILRRVFGNVHPTVAGSLNDLALLLDDMGQLEAAAATYQESLDTFRKLYAGDHPNIAEVQTHLAGVIGALGDLQTAQMYYRDSIAMLDRTVGREHMLTARAIDSYSVFLLLHGRYQEAEPLMAEAVSLHKTLLGDRHQSTSRVLNNMATLLFLKGDYSRAEPLYRESLSITLEHSGEDSDLVANRRNNLADLLNRVGRYEEAEQLAAKAAQTYGKVFSPSHWRAAVARNVHGASLAGLGRYEEAEDLLVNSIGIIGEARPGTTYHRSALRRMINLYTLTDNPEREQHYREQLNCLDSPTDC